MTLFQRMFGGGGSARIDGSRARELVASGAQLVDVRSPGEFSGGALPGARNLPVDQILARVHELDAGRPVVLYCRSGARSSSVVQALKGAGIAEVYDLGPMSAW